MSEVFSDLIEPMQALNLRERPTQMEMIRFVYESLIEKSILCIEAPTGTGKTLAYGLAGLKARQAEKVLVVSTATTALQEQFFINDLPLLEKILNKKFQVVLAKGRRRYVCHARIFHPERFFEDEAVLPEIGLLQNALTDGSWSGAFDDLETKVEPAVWQKISTDAQGCSAGRCDYFNQCVFFQNRRKMYHADVVVTNHSLLLSDLELGGGVVLPAMQDSIYVLDECHHFPEKALAHFAKQAAVMRSFDWLNSIGKVLAKIVLQVSLNQQHIEDLTRTVKEMVEVLRQVKIFLDNCKNHFEQNQLRITELSAHLKDLAQALVQHSRYMSGILQSLLRMVEQAHERYQQSDPVKAVVIEPLRATLDYIYDRCENFYAIWSDVLSLNLNSDQMPIACWFEYITTRDGEDYTLHTSPINISAAMKTLFWDKLEQGAVLCSATIRSMGAFDDFLRKLGLKNNPAVSVQKLDSPFFYHHSVLFVPSMQYEPTQAMQTAHLQEMLILLPRLILPASGTLVLFTSRQAMWFVFKNIDRAFKNNILLQDDYNKMELIKRHKKQIDQKKASIIFGLASFAEGIDLPGQYCEHVIIQKIPFSVPSDPIAQTRSEWLKKHHKDAFQLITLPETSIKIAQYIGRLLRHEQDRGIVTILDKRLYSKRYGQSLLHNIPDFTRLLNVNIDQFLQHELVQKFY